MMRILLKRIPLLLFVGAILSCEKPNQPQPKPDDKPSISIPTQSQAVFNNGISFSSPSPQQANQPQTQTVTFTATESWSATVTDTKASTWLTVEPSSGGAGTVNMTVKAQPNDTDQARRASVTIKCGSMNKTFTVEQAAKSAATVAVTEVTLNKTELTLKVGDTETLVATVKPDDATDKTVTWSTSDASIATVDESGKVTAVKEGSATITAKAGDKSATCKVTVSKNVIAVTSVILNKSKIELIEGDSETLVATVKPDDATDKTVTWSSSDEAIAKVDNNGKVTAVKEGTATITAKAGEKSATCSVTVSKKVVAVTGITLNKSSLKLNEGDSETLVATVKPDDATDKTVTWSTSDASIATVDSNGKVTAVKEGTATITAKAGEQTATCLVSITEQKVSVSPTSLNLISAGGIKQIQIICNDNWSISGNPDWCTVSASSGSGDATVQLSASANNGPQRAASLTVSCGGKTAKVSITQLGGGWQNQRFVHKSLLMFFTSIWCGWSNYMNESIHMADKQVGDKYLRVDVHGRGLGNAMDDSPINFPDAPKLEGLYYTATPSGIVDYRIRLRNYSDKDRHKVKETLVAAIKQQEEVYPAATGVSFSSELSGKSLSVTGTLYAHKADSYKLSVYLLEDAVEFRDELLNKVYYFDNVLRLSLSETLGDDISISSDNMTKDFHYSISIPDGYKENDLSILVIVQRQYGSQNIVREAYFGDYYVDNCRKAKVGIEAPLETYDSISGGGNEGYDEGDMITF